MTVLIPAYEPTEKMLSLVLELKKRTNYKVLIIDDGSGVCFRGLFDKAKDYGCTVLRHSVNKGKGEALKKGFTYLCAECDREPVVCADSDGQHKVDDMIKLANAIDGNKFEMVLGVRQFDGRVPYKSRMGNRITAFFFKLATGIDLEDTQTGLRGYPYEMNPWLLSVDGKRFEYELNLLLKSKESGISIKQVPIATIYDNNNKGTHFSSINDSVRVIMPLLKFCGSSITSGILDFILLFLFQWLTGSLFWGVVLAITVSSILSGSIGRSSRFQVLYLFYKSPDPPKSQGDREPRLRYISAR
jgi:glycosyltransferase involved in cell wall biosynthesis